MPLTFVVGMLPNSSVFAPITRATSSHILRDVMVEERETDVSIVMSRLTPPACAIRRRRTDDQRASEGIRGHQRSSEVISTPARSDGAEQSPASLASSAMPQLVSSVGRALNRPPRCLIRHRRPSRSPEELHHRLGWSRDLVRGKRARVPPSRACPPRARQAWRRVTRSPRPRRSHRGWRAASPPAKLSHIGQWGGCAKLGRLYQIREGSQAIIVQSTGHTVGNGGAVPPRRWRIQPAAAAELIRGNQRSSSEVIIRGHQHTSAMAHAACCCPAGEPSRRSRTCRVGKRGRRGEHLHAGSRPADVAPEGAPRPFRRPWLRRSSCSACAPC